MDATTMLVLIAWVTILSSCTLSPTLASDAKEEKKDSCEYDMDLTANVIKIVCQGSASKVNVYADTAHVSSDDVDGAGNSKTGSDYDTNKNGNTKTDDLKSKYGPQMKSGGHEGMTNGRGGSRKDRRKKFPKNAGSSKNDNSGNAYTHQDMNAKNGMTSPAAQKDHWVSWELPKLDGSFSNVVWNATQKLDDAKKKLSSYTNFIRNISSQLSDGDVTLRADMDRLRRTSNSATVLKEGIIAAMRNQFNFMRSALLTRNNEVERLVTTLKVLVEVTSDGLQGTFLAHKTAMEQVHHINTTMTAIRRKMAHELRRRKRRYRKGEKSGNKPKVCPKEISAFGAGRAREVKDVPVGAYMMESLNPNDPGTVWVMQGSEPSDTLLEFDIDKDIDYKLVGRFIALPYKCIGTGHAIYRRHFYCHLEDSNRVAKYHLKTMDIVAQLELPGVSKSRNKYPYQSGQNTDVDLAVDEMGMWAIYATDASHGNIVISKINHQNMEVERTWPTRYPKRRLGNAFMICGVLYAIDSSSDAPTYIRYSYDTETEQDRIWEPGKLPFPNSAISTMTNTNVGSPANTASTSSKDMKRKNAVNCVMLTYDLRSSTIFSWNNGRVEKFPVYFKDTEP